MHVHIYICAFTRVLLDPGHAATTLSSYISAAPRTPLSWFSGSPGLACAVSAGGAIVEEQLLDAPLAWKSKLAHVGVSSLHRLSPVSPAGAVD